MTRRHIILQLSQLELIEFGILDCHPEQRKHADNVKPGELRVDPRSVRSEPVPASPNRNFPRNLCRRRRHEFDCREIGSSKPNIRVDTS